MSWFRKLKKKHKKQRKLWEQSQRNPFMTSQHPNLSTHLVSERANNPQELYEIYCQRAMEDPNLILPYSDLKIFDNGKTETDEDSIMRDNMEALDDEFAVKTALNRLSILLKDNKEAANEWIKLRKKNKKNMIKNSREYALERTMDDTLKKALNLMHPLAPLPFRNFEFHMVYTGNVSTGYVSFEPLAMLKCKCQYYTELPDLHTLFNFNARESAFQISHHLTLFYGEKRAQYPDHLPWEESNPHYVEPYDSNYYNQEGAWAWD